MALPRPALLAVAGAMLSLLSFTVMRAVGAQPADLPLPVADSAPAPAAKAAAQKKPPPPRVEDVPAATASALASGKVVVLLFTERGAADDQATAAHFKSLSRLGDRIRPFRAPIERVGRYAGIVSNLGITQAPSIVIVRPDLRAVPPIEGYVESGYLLQRVKDQLP